MEDKKSSNTTVDHLPSSRQLPSSPSKPKTSEQPIDTSIQDTVFVTQKLANFIAEKTLKNIERNKDKLNLKPNIDFVTKYKNLYEQGISQISARVPDQEAIDWSKEIQFYGADDIVLPQLTPEECQQLLARMPKSLIQMSTLVEISYHINYQHIRKIPVPGFNEQGNFAPQKVELVSVDEFPRPQDHPSRILVGMSNGLTIFPTPIPSSVSTDERAIHLYQIHVFLHEFFHTIDYQRRNPQERAKILLETDGQEFTLQDWWEEFENLLISGQEPECVSIYANTYLHKLTPELKENNYPEFTQAVAEQICESFAAYQLGIISNNTGWTSFQAHHFNNSEQLAKHAKGQAKSANLKWTLIDKLCRATVKSKE